jgi:hypothetical protein
MDNASNNEKMMRYLSHRLKDEQGIDWDPYEHHVACLNHVINLAVDDFMKAIKVYMEETEDCLHVVNDDDDESDESDESDDSIPMEIRIEGIMSTIFKLRIIGKVESLYSIH